MLKKESSTTLGYEDKLWLAADKLRGSMDSSEYKHVALGLIFLKYVSDYEKYNIVGFEHGLREYNGENNTMKNNTTREYESLDII